jgi:RecB family exonuclease
LGEDAQRALCDVVVAAQELDRFAPVTVIAPTSRSAIVLRRALARDVAERTGRAGVANVTFVVLRRFCHEIVGDALVSAGRRPLSRIALEAACRAVLDERPIFGAHSRSAATVSELADRYVELRSSGDGAIEALERRSGLARDVAVLTRAIRERVGPTHFDDTDLYETTARAARHNEVPSHPIVLYLPEPSTSVVDDLFDALAHAAPVTEIAAGIDGGTPDLRGHSTIPESSDRVEGFSEILFLHDAHAEVREAARIVARRLEQGVSAEEIAVLYPRRRPYAELVGVELDRCAIPWSGPPAGSIASSVSARALSSLVRLRSGTIERTDLVRLVASIVGRPGSDDEESVGVFDRITRRIGLTAAPFAEWERRILDDFADAEIDRDGQESVLGDHAAPSRRRVRDARAARSFAQLLGSVRRHLDRIAEASTWEEATEALSSALDALIEPGADRCAWVGPAGESERLVIDVLAEIGALDGIERYENGSSLQGAIEAACERDGPQIGRLGAGVIVGPLEHGFGITLDTLVVLGCAEGELPSRPSSSPLLSVTDREVAGLENRTPSGSAGRDRRRLLLALAGSSWSVALVPRYDAATGRERVPSRFLSGGPEPRVVQRSSSTTATGEVAPRDVLLQVLVDTPPGEPSVQWIETVLPEIRRARERARSRHDAGCGPFDGAAPGTAPLAVVAPTTIETVALCPFRFFADHLLATEVVDEPERRVTITPEDRGLAIHAILEEYGRRSIEGTLPPTSQGRAATLEEIAHAHFGELERFGRTGTPVLWEIESTRILANLEAERRRDELAREATTSEIIAVEHRFGPEEGTVAPPSVEVGGRQITFRGTIDRVDRASDGSLDVIDYKSGSARVYRTAGDDPVARGRHLQLPIYALAASASFGAGRVSARYRFVGDEPDEIEFRLDAEGRDRFTTAIGILVETVDGGHFPYRPRDGREDHCRFCDFDAICPADRSDRWEAVRTLPAFASYLALVEPRAASDDATDPEDDAPDLREEGAP